MKVNTYCNNIFGRVNSRKYVLTYHNLPQNIDLSQELINFKTQIVTNIINDRKDYTVTEVYMAKEPYTDKEKMHLIHIHALIVFKKAIRINSPSKFASLLSIEYQGEKHYPHVSELVNIHAYKNYITKLQALDAKYIEPEWYNYWLDNSIELAIDERIKTVARKPNIKREDIMKIINSYDLDLVMKYRSKIDFLYAKCPAKYEVDMIHQIKITRENLEYTDINYLDDPRYAKLKQHLYEFYNNTVNKKSLRIIGGANEYKSSMVKAASVQYQEDNQHLKILIVCAIDIEHLKCLNKVDQMEYDKILVIIDDFDINEEEYSRDQILSILSGNYVNSSIPARYENIYFSRQTYKVFIHNAKFQSVIKKIKEEMIARVDEFTINSK